MIGRKTFIALFAVLAVALAPGAAVVASAADGGTAALATPSKSKKQGKKGKGKRKSCKGKKGKAKKKCLRNQRKSKKGAGKLANGRYEYENEVVVFKVTGGGRKVQLDTIALPGLCAPLSVGSERRVALKSRKGKLVAEQSFTVRGTQTVVEVDWSAEIDPRSLQFSLLYDARFELVAPEQPSLRCEDSGRYGGKLSH